MRNITFVARGLVVSLMLLAGFTGLSGSARGQSIARQWNDLMLDAIRVDTARPTVHARNLFHVSAAMYDAWAAYDPVAVGYITDETQSAANVDAARAEAVSFAAYRVLNNRFANSPGAAASLAAFNAKMDSLGYDRNFTSTAGNSPAAIGNRVAENMISYGLADGSNQAANYADTSGYVPSNAPLVVQTPGITLVDRNLWQPLTIPTATGGTATPPFLTPHWGEIRSFGLTKAPGSVFHDPGPPPFLGTPSDAQYKAEYLEVARLESYLTPDDGVTINRPAVCCQRHAARRLGPRAGGVLGRRPAVGDAAGTLERNLQPSDEPSGAGEADRRRGAGRQRLGVGREGLLCAQRRGSQCRDRRLGHQGGLQPDSTHLGDPLHGQQGTIVGSGWAVVSSRRHPLGGRSG
jgi:hypothetical protein